MCLPRKGLKKYTADAGDGHRCHCLGTGLPRSLMGAERGKVDTFVVKCLKDPLLATNLVHLAMKKQVLIFWGGNSGRRCLVWFVNE
jgi:hypothetical protein